MPADRLRPVNAASTAEPRVVVGAAIRAGREILAAARAYPPELAGLWEFPGGKVEPGETEAEALRRECREELGVEIAVGPRACGDLLTGGGRFLLRIYFATLEGGEPRAKEHAELRWLAPEALDSVPWLPGNRPAVEAIRESSVEPR
ncbi:8-oxo-dGTP diphosphatase [Glycomyces harbinensis]|uniref:8-oxo-dGTP diphosphatase n=1 Tax=Glycomyces harbinensis TaxID=58114 RepID=A0A1G7CBL2_9ACTN|nr:8-oxo-dGTP diphosphatase [Glycomyces harbinensis]